MNKEKAMPHPAYDNDSGFSNEEVKLDKENLQVQSIENNIAKSDKEVKIKEDKIEKSLTKKQDKNLAHLDKYTFTSLAIGEKAFQYIAIFKKIYRGKVIIPSLSAGVFGLTWLIYRRAAVHGFLAYVILVSMFYNVITHALHALPKAAQLGLIFALPHIVLYFIGNLIYLYSIRKKVDKAKNKYGSSSAIVYLSQQGGTIGGFALISSIIMLQGSVFLFVYSLFYIDSFTLNIWSDFLALSTIKK